MDALPGAFDRLQRTEVAKSVVVVVLPLGASMQDQQNCPKQGLSARCVSEGSSLCNEVRCAIRSFLASIC